MSEQCPHCHSSLPDYWWEQQVPQGKWTEQQQQASAQRQQATLRYQGALKNALGRDLDNDQ